LPGASDLFDERLDIGAQELRRRVADGADQVEMARMPVRRLVPRAPFAEVDFPRDAGVDHPLQRPVDRRTADPGRGAVDALEQILGADVPLLADEHLNDAIALGRTLTPSGPKRGEIGKLTIHLVNWRMSDLVIESPIHQIANSPIVR